MTRLSPRAARVLAAPSFIVAPSGRCWQSPRVGVREGLLLDAPVRLAPPMTFRRPPPASSAPACPQVP